MKQIRYELDRLMTIEDTLKSLLVSVSARDAILAALKRGGMDVLKAEAVLGLCSCSESDGKNQEELENILVVGMALNATPAFNTPTPTFEVGLMPRPGLEGLWPCVRYTTSSGVTFGWLVSLRHPAEGKQLYRPFIIARQGGTLERALVEAGWIKVD